MTIANGQDAQQRLRRMLDERSFSTVYQPIVHLNAQRIVGYEALTRFSAEPLRDPGVWFADAAAVGMQAEMELTMLDAALDGLAVIPPDAFVFLNVSPATLRAGSLPKLLQGQPMRRLVLELAGPGADETESWYGAIEALRGAGLRLAVDAGAVGLASLRRLHEVRPDVIKIPRSLIQSIDEQPVSRALVAAIVGFGEQAGCWVVAEGVETTEELHALRQLRVSHAQGFLLGRPAPLDWLQRAVPQL